MQTDKRTLLLPPCKINIGLNVVARRADGYHDLETVFYPVPLRDNLEFKISDDVTAPYTLATGGVPVAGDASDNLVVKVYMLLKRSLTCRPWTSIFTSTYRWEPDLAGAAVMPP